MATRTKKRPSRSEASDETSERSSTRDIWKGSITFGLVEIPVALVAAEQPGGLSLSYLDKRDFSPVGYRRYNKSNDEDVPWSEIVHGYEYEKGEYVVLSKQDLARANPALTQTISIESFVDAADIEPIYFEKPYYLEPLKKGSKAYALLRETLRKTKKVGVARVAVRTREHIAVVGVRENALVLYLLRFAKEVRAPSALDNLESKPRATAVSAKEIQLAERLVADMSGDWNPEDYTDEYEADVMKLIDKKVKAGETHVLDDREPAPKRQRGEVFDLMPLLRRSVEAAAHTSRARSAKSHGSTSAEPVKKKRGASSKSPARRRRA